MNKKPYMNSATSFCLICSDINQPEDEELVASLITYKTLI